MVVFQYSIPYDWRTLISGSIVEEDVLGFWRATEEYKFLVDNDISFRYTTARDVVSAQDMIRIDADLTPELLTFWKLKFE